MASDGACFESKSSSATHPNDLVADSSSQQETLSTVTEKKEDVNGSDNFVLSKPSNGKLT